MINMSWVVARWCQFTEFTAQPHSPVSFLTRLLILKIINLAERNYRLCATLPNANFNFSYCTMVHLLLMNIEF